MLSIGDFNVVNVLVQLEQRVLILERIVETLNNRNSTLPGYNPINQEDVANFKKIAAEELITKYPSLGLKIDSNEPNN